MKLKIKILPLLLAICSAGLWCACSDNSNDNFYPASGDMRTLTLPEFPDANNRTINLDAGTHHEVVKVESNTRWIAVVEGSVGSWCQIDNPGDIGNGEFTIVTDRNLQENRTCFVTVYMTDVLGQYDEEHSVRLTIYQTASNVYMSPSAVEPFAPTNPLPADFNIFADNVPWTLTCRYETSDTEPFVTIMPADADLMTENSDGSFSGHTDAAFSIQLQSNRSSAQRIATLTVTSEVGSFSVSLTQTGSEYTFDVSPSAPQHCRAEGDTIVFGILALSDWNVATAASDWISIMPSSGTSSAERTTVTAVIAPNITGQPRTNTIRFTPTDDRYAPVSVTVTQDAPETTFTVSPVDLSVFPESGGDFTFTVDARFDWVIEAPAWIAFNGGSGSAFERPLNIEAYIAANNSGGTRTGDIVFTPRPTRFFGSIMVDPETVGVHPVRISVTQFGGREPALSVPWVVDGYTQNEATVECSYHSPYYPLTGGGIEWRRTGESDWHQAAATIDNPSTGIISVRLTGLDGRTTYEVRGYAVIGDGQIVYGTTSQPFTTAGALPGNGDNGTPDLP